MPQNMPWKDAVLRVLQDSTEPMHYADIAEQVAKQGLREELGATPASTVNAVITTSLQTDINSPFVRATRGIYGLRQSVVTTSASAASYSSIESESPDTGVINAFGMFWDRTKVIWSANPRVLGQQQSTSTAVDFCDQKGVYMLHDAQGVVYVGRVTDQSLGRRLQQHTTDRLNGRWDRFSWFGVFRVRDNGTLAKEGNIKTYDLDVLITTMEAVLIEGLEPRQNRRRGDDFQAVEFLQVEDPDLVRNRKVAFVREILESVQKPN